MHCRKLGSRRYILEAVSACRAFSSKASRSGHGISLSASSRQALASGPNVLSNTYRDAASWWHKAPFPENFGAYSDDETFQGVFDGQSK